MLKEKKGMFRIGAVLFALIMTCLFHTRAEASVVSDYEQEGRRVIEIEATEGADTDTTVIQNALSSANNGKLTVILKPGKYRIHYALKLFNNTHLIASGAEIEQIDPYRGLLINARYTNSPFGDAEGGYDSCENITVEGGTWIGGIPDGVSKSDKRFTGGYSAIMFLHGKNIKIKDLEMINNFNGHFIELGGVDGAVVENCKLGLKGKYIGEPNNEAIQIDNTFAKANSPVGAPFDDTPSKNITIKGCDIKFVRGIGTNHKGNAFYDNIVIEKNKIRSTTAECINLYDCRKIKIGKNQLKVLHDTKSYLSVAIRIGIGEDNDRKIKPSVVIDKNNLEGYYIGIKISDRKDNSNGYEKVLIKNNKIKTGFDKKNAIQIWREIPIGKLEQQKNVIK